jgi:hypothetical protein
VSSNVLRCRHSSIRPPAGHQLRPSPALSGAHPCCRGRVPSDEGLIQRCQRT